MTAAVILKLVEENKLYLDETLKKIAKRYKGEIALLVHRYPDLSMVTFRELLNHTIGVPQSINTAAYKDRFAKNPRYFWSADRLVELAMRNSLYFKPGTKGY